MPSCVRGMKPEQPSPPGVVLAGAAQGAWDDFGSIPSQKTELPPCWSGDAENASRIPKRGGRRARAAASLMLHRHVGPGLRMTLRHGTPPAPLPALCSPPHSLPSPFGPTRHALTPWPLALSPRRPPFRVRSPGERPFESRPMERQGGPPVPPDVEREAREVEPDLIRSAHPLFNTRNPLESYRAAAPDPRTPTRRRHPCGWLRRLVSFAGWKPAPRPSCIPRGPCILRGAGIPACDSSAGFKLSRRGMGFPTHDLPHGSGDPCHPKPAIDGAGFDFGGRSRRRSACCSRSGRTHRVRRPRPVAPPIRGCPPCLFFVVVPSWSRAG
jgi:hypothetical protein